MFKIDYGAVEASLEQIESVVSNVQEAEGKLRATTFPEEFNRQAETSAIASLINLNASSLNGAKGELNATMSRISKAMEDEKNLVGLLRWGLWN